VARNTTNSAALQQLTAAYMGLASDVNSRGLAAVVPGVGVALSTIGSAVAVQSASELSKLRVLLLTLLLQINATNRQFTCVFGRSHHCSHHLRYQPCTCRLHLHSVCAAALG
jgi:hypothetical protein